MSEDPENFDDVTPENLQNRLNAYHKAIEEEFKVAQSVASNEVELFQSKKEFFRKALPTAMAQIVHLAVNSTSDSVRLAASKLIVAESFAAGHGSEEPDLTKLLDNLRRSPSTAPTGSSDDDWDKLD